MKSLMLIVAVGCILISAGGCNTASVAQPTADQAKPALYGYLMGEYSDATNVSIAKLENIRVGNYDGLFEGWPIHADYAVKYQKDGMHGTYNGNSDAAACWAKVVDGRVECFKPAMFADAEKEMNAQFEKAMDKAFADFN